MTRTVGRAGVIVASIAVTALIAAGCSSTESNAPEESSGESAALVPEAEGAVQYPLTLNTWAGETVLETRPERIAVVGTTTNVDSLAAIGVTPVFAEDASLTSEWLDPEWVDAIEVKATSDEGFPYEAIASAQPDLIVAVFATGGDQDLYDQLSSIAPVLESETLPTGDFGNQGEWRLTQELIGQALDLNSASEQAIADTDKVFEELAAANPKFEGKTATIASAYVDGTGEYFSRTGANSEQILEQLGFVHNPSADRFVDDTLVSAENFGLLDADALLLIIENEETEARLESSELFTQIPAVADGRYTGVIEGSADLPSGAQTGFVLRRGASTLALSFELPRITDWLARALPA